MHRFLRKWWLDGVDEQHGADGQRQLQLTPPDQTVSTHELWAGTSPTPTTLVARDNGPVPSGYIGPSSLDGAWRLVVNGAAYEWRERAYNGSIYGTWSSWVQLTVDTSAPATPGITSSFPRLARYERCILVGRYDASSDVVWYGYFLDNGPTNWVTSATTSTAESGLWRSYLWGDGQDQVAGYSESDFNFAIGNGYLTSPLDQGYRTQRFVALTSTAPSGVSVRLV